jgi:hypothetical protein
MIEQDDILIQRAGPISIGMDTTPIEEKVFTGEDILGERKVESGGVRHVT